MGKGMGTSALLDPLVSSGALLAFAVAAVYRMTQISEEEGNCYLSVKGRAFEDERCVEEMKKVRATRRCLFHSYNTFKRILVARKATARRIKK